MEIKIQNHHLGLWGLTVIMILKKVYGFILKTTCEDLLGERKFLYYSDLQQHKTPSKQFKYTKAPTKNCLKNTYVNL